jgi:hypothetical protein
MHSFNIKGTGEGRGLAQCMLRDVSDQSQSKIMPTYENIRRAGFVFGILICGSGRGQYEPEGGAAHPSYLAGGSSIFLFG